MSYHHWTIVGYGFCVDDIQVASADRLKKLISLAPEFENDINQWMEDWELAGSSVDEYFEYEDDSSYTGLAPILRFVIEEVEGIGLIVCDDYNSNMYLLFGPRYPWNITETEKTMTEEKLNDMFRKYISIISDDAVNIDYYVVENGG